MLAPSLHPPTFLKGLALRIVVIEDNVAVAKGLRYVLQDAGHAVDLLHDGSEAATFLRDDGADIIVLDINMPGQDGLTILRDLRARGYAPGPAADSAGPDQ